MRALKVSAVAFVATIMMAAPAHAYYEAWYSDAVQTTASGTTVKNYDRKCDARATQANYFRGGSSTLYESTNHGGCGSVLTTYAASPVIQLRACLVIPGQPDPCGPWDFSG